MKHLIPVIIAVLAAMLPARAEDVIRNIGYTSTDAIDVEGAYFGSAGTYSVGCYFSPEFLENFDGCRIIGMRVAAAEDLGRTRMFVYEAGSLTTPVVEQRQRLYKGWNQVSFSGNGLTIDRKKPLFVGFDYVETAAMVEAESGGLCCAGTYAEGGFVFLSGGSLRIIEFQANLCVQMIVDVSNLPEHDMAFGFFDPGFRYHKANENFEMMAQLRNVGRVDASTMTLAYRFDNQPAVTVDVAQAMGVGSDYTWQLSTAIPADLAPGSHTFTAWVQSVDGQTVDAQAKASRRVSAKFFVYTEQLKRHFPFVEVYSGQGSYYSAALEDAFRATMAGSADLAQVVNLYSADDALHVPASKYWYSTYAPTITPCFTINRSYFPAEKNIAYTEINDYLFVMPDFMITGLLEEMIAYDNSAATLADITLTGSYDASARRLRVTASGDLAPDALACYGEVGVTLMLVEDGVKSPQIKLNTEAEKLVTDMNFLHDNVLRAYITSPQGDVVTPADGKYTATYTFDVNPDWNVDRLRVVGIVGSKPASLTAENLKYYDVSDANAVAFKDLASISDITADAAADDEELARYYTIDGRQAAKPLSPGLYIRQASNGTATKVRVQ